MTEAQILEDIKRNIGSGDLENAWKLLRQHLDSDVQFKNLKEEALPLLAQFNKAKKDEIQGILSDDKIRLNFNTATQQLLYLIGKLERGELEADSSLESIGKKGRSQKWLYLTLALSLAGLALVLWLFVFKTKPALEETPENCPQFEMPESFNILLLPFRALNENRLQPHIAISERLSLLKDQFQINCGIKFYNLDENNPNAYPATGEEAGRIGENCSAKLIIWGTAEQTTNNAIIQTRYRFINLGEKLELTKIAAASASEIDTISTISSITSEGLLTENIEESIKLIFGLVARESGKSDVAINMLEQFSTADSSAILLKGMVLAEEYLNTDQQEKAIESYNEVIAWHPNYGLARNNRGMLYYAKERYAEAASDLDVALKHDSLNIKLWQSQTDAYLKVEQYAKAKENLLKLQKIKPELRASTTEQLRVIEQKIDDEEKLKSRAEQRLVANPNDVKALESKAISSVKLGEYQDAVNSAESILRRDPDNANAYAQLIITYHTQGEMNKVDETVKRANEAGVKTQSLNQLLPFQLNNLPIVSRIKMID